jgi:hypothetical protein
MDLVEHGPQLGSFAAAGEQQPDGLARTWRTKIIVGGMIACLALPRKPAHSARAHAREVLSPITQRETARRRSRVPIADYALCVDSKFALPEET